MRPQATAPTQNTIRRPDLRRNGRGASASHLRVRGVSFYVRTACESVTSDLVEGLRECQQRQDAELKEQKNIIQAQQAYIDRLKQIVHQR